MEDKNVIKMEDIENLEDIMKRVKLKFKFFFGLDFEIFLELGNKIKLEKLKDGENPLLFYFEDSTQFFHDCILAGFDFNNHKLNELPGVPLLLKEIEKVIYDMDDFKYLIEMSRNIGRKVINQECHRDYIILKNHISEQLQYIELSKKYPLIDITPHQTLSIETTTANVEEGKPNKKQPSAKVMMAFINLIDDRAKIIPKDSINNDVKFTILSNKIKELFKYEYAGKTLEKDQYKLEGYSLEVYNLLTEWEYNTEALKYKNRHNL